MPLGAAGSWRLSMDSHVLVVTGGGRGIGAEIVRLAARAGMATAFSYRADEAAARALADEVGSAGGIALPFRRDIAEPETARALLDEVEDRLGPVSMLVNNAGVTGPIGPFVAASVETLRRTTEVNLLGTMWLA